MAEMSADALLHSILEAAISSRQLADGNRQAAPAVASRQLAITCEYWLLIAGCCWLRRANGSQVAAGRSVEVRQRPNRRDRESLGGEEARFGILFEIHESGHAGHHGC